MDETIKKILDESLPPKERLKLLKQAYYSKPDAALYNTLLKLKESRCISLKYVAEKLLKNFPKPESKKNPAPSPNTTPPTPESPQLKLKNKKNKPPKTLTRVKISNSKPPERTQYKTPYHSPKKKISANKYIISGIAILTIIFIMLFIKKLTLKKPGPTLSKKLPSPGVNMVKKPKLSLNTEKSTKTTKPSSSKKNIKLLKNILQGLNVNLNTVVAGINSKALEQFKHALAIYRQDMLKAIDHYVSAYLIDSNIVKLNERGMLFFIVSTLYNNIEKVKLKDSTNYMLGLICFILNQKKLAYEFFKRIHHYKNFTHSKLINKILQKYSPEKVKTAGIKKEIPLAKINSLYKKKRYTECLKLLKSNLLINPDNPVYHHLAGKILSENYEAYDEAITHLTTAIKLNPWHYESYYLLGKCYVKTGKLKLAKKTFGQLLIYSKNPAFTAAARQFIKSQKVIREPDVSKN